MPYLKRFILQSLDCHVGSSVWMYKLLHVAGRQVSVVKVKDFADRFVWPQIGIGNLKAKSSNW